MRYRDVGLTIAAGNAEPFKASVVTPEASSDHVNECQLPPASKSGAAVVGDSSGQAFTIESLVVVHLNIQQDRSSDTLQRLLRGVHNPLDIRSTFLGNFLHLPTCLLEIIRSDCFVRAHSTHLLVLLAPRISDACRSLLACFGRFTYYSFPGVGCRRWYVDEQK